MYLLQAARDADGGRRRRRRRSPSSCLLCAESPEMLEMKLGLSISSGLIAYLPGWASASKASSLSLFRSHCLACTLAGLMKYLLTALFDQLATGLLMSRALHQASEGGLGGGAAPPWTLRKYLLSKLHFTCVSVCVCARCVHILFMFTYRNQFEVKPFEQDMKNPFMLFSQLQNQFLNFSLLQCSMPGHIYLP